MTLDDVTPLVRRIVLGGLERDGFDVRPAAAFPPTEFTSKPSTCQVSATRLDSGSPGQEGVGRANDHSVHPAAFPLVDETFVLRGAGGLVFTTRFAHGGRTSRNALENELAKLHVRQKNSLPNHPTTCGKVERFQQTMRRWLRTQPAAATITELQTELDVLVGLYNHHRPHRSLPNHTTPAVTYTTRPRATPANHHPDSEFRVRHDRINDGNVSLRINGAMHHIGLGRTLDGTPVILLIHHLDIRVIHATTGEIIRTLTINPERRYHGTGRPPGGPQRPRKFERSEP